MAGRAHHRAALALTVLSLLVWWTWALQQTCHPFHDLSCGTYTDHFSHMNTGRLFTEVGADIWRKPLRDSGRPLTPQEIAALPDDVRLADPGDLRTFPGWPASKPFYSSWTINPRLHPPGDMLLTAPVALLYSFTSLSLSGANLLLILLFLLYVHIPIYLLFREWRPSRARAPAGMLAAAIIYLELVHWALEGFYEGLVVAPLLLCARAVHRRDGTRGLFWFSLAALLHFRAFFFAPWAVYALYLVASQQEWRRWGRRGAALATGAAVLAAASLAPFALLWSTLHRMPVSNPLNPAEAGFHVFKIAPLVVVLVVAGAAFALSRSWLDLAVLTWLELVVLQLHEALPWDMLTLLAWLAAPILALESRIPVVRDARLFAVLCLSVLVFHNTLTPDWFTKVVGGLAAR